MAPTKNSTRVVQTKTVTANSNSMTTTLLPLARKGLTRRGTHNFQDQNADIMHTRGKRKAEHSPVKNEKVKRCALGNLTDNVNVMTMGATMVLSDDDIANKHHNLRKKDLPAPLVQMQVLKDMQNSRQLQHQNQNQHPLQQQHPNKIATRAATRNAAAAAAIKIFDDINDAKSNSAPTANANVNALVAQPKKVEFNTKLITIASDVIVAPLPPPPKISVSANGMKAPHKPVRRISNEFNKTEESLYMSALEDVSSCESMRLSGNFEAAKRRSVLLQQDKYKTETTIHEGTTEQMPDTTSDEGESDETASSDISAKIETAVVTMPDGVEDFDKVNWNDPFQVSHYAMDIFEYLKSRESQFPIDDYMEKQVHLSKWMRSLLVDWMVEVQETFELNHETLYLAVKIVDLYLCRVVINKEKLQLLGAAAFFIACKFDERTPPLIEDFLYICDGAYKHDELIHMEMAVLRIIDYDLGIPLSYRFLRRYARCAKVPMPTLTLARYILELSLMDYATISFSDSKLACAALFMALRLHGDKFAWTPTLEYYSGYKITDFADIVPILNAGMHRKPKGTIKTIRSKYSHKIFHEVAKVRLMTTDELFEYKMDLNISV